MTKTLARPKIPPSRRLDGRIRGRVDAPALWASLPADERAAFLQRLPADARTLDRDSLELMAALAFASSRGHKTVVAHGARIDMPRRFIAGGPLRVAAGGGA